MHPKPNGSAAGIAETLLAVTLNASSCVSCGDWETACQLLRRRDQLIDLLARCDNLASVEEILQRICLAEKELAAKMDAATTRAMEEISKIRRFRRNPFFSIEEPDVAARGQQT